MDACDRPPNSMCITFFDPDFEEIYTDLNNTLCTFVPPSDEERLAPELSDALRTVCTVAKPYLIICDAFRAWSATFADSPDPDVRAAIAAVAEWLLHPTGDTTTTKRSSLLDLDSLRTAHTLIPPASRNWLCSELLFLHLCSGRRRSQDLQCALEEIHLPTGFVLTVLSVDVAIDSERCDLSREDLRQTWLHMIATGEIAGGGVGPPCETWSVARFVPGTKGERVPRPLRFRSMPWGSLDITRRESAQVEIGNLLMGFALRVCLLLGLQGRFCFLEHPEDPVPLQMGPEVAPSIWATSPVRWLCDTGLFGILHLSQGHFGARSAKPTAFLLCGIDMEEAQRIERECRTQPLPSACTVGKRGKEWATKQLKEYPPGLNRMLGRLFAQWLSCQTSLDRSTLSTEHRWVLDLHRTLLEAPAKAGPAPDFHQRPVARN